MGPAVEREREATHSCCVSKCRKSTREGKPYCPDHVMALGYPKKVSDRWDLIMAERDSLESPKDPKKPAIPDSSWLLIEECLLIVAAQELVCCRSKICRELGLSPENADKIARASGLRGVRSERSVSFHPTEAAKLLRIRRRG